jgi:hypothetical protein
MLARAPAGARHRVLPSRDGALEHRPSCGPHDLLGRAVADHYKRIKQSTVDEWTSSPA